jgi:hypothetical protein
MLAEQARRVAAPAPPTIERQPQAVSAARPGNGQAKPGNGGARDLKRWGG